MNVLLLRLVGPMQSWGTQSRFTIRDTGLEPSKSGVIGLICAALGRRRKEPVNDLAVLRMGVRIEREGKMESDFHTALHVIKASGDPSKPGEAVISTRFYLADADFLVGLEGEDLNLLMEIDRALQAPRWTLYLGRKAFPTGKPVHLQDGLQPGQDLLQALRQYPRAAAQDADNRKQVRLVLEDPDGEAVRVDQPVAPFIQRRFAPRRIKIEYVSLDEIPVRREAPCTSRS